MHAAITPAETLFVVDAMTGQDAANTARAFADALPLSGVVLSKADGDARGGAALSVRQVTGRPIKFLGMGEKIDALEPFHPERMASRILGMGDVLTLIEEAERKLDKKKADKLARKIQKGKGFDLEDFRDQLQQMKNMGGMAGMLDKLPGMGQMGKAAESVDQKHFDRMEAMIGSMTPHERRFPDVINGSRKQRIARGSGVQIQDVNRLLKQHKQMQKMMKKLGKKGGMQKMMRGMSGMMGGQGGGMPPGGLPPASAAEPEYGVRPLVQVSPATALVRFAFGGGRASFPVRSQWSRANLNMGSDPIFRFAGLGAEPLFGLKKFGDIAVGIATRLA